MSGSNGHVLVCVKRSPDITGEVVLTPDGTGLDARWSGWATSAHEASAVEIAVQVAERSGGSVTVLTLGGEEALEQLRAALAVGADDAVHVVADSDRFGPADVAREIAAVVRDREAAGTAYDLVLLGNDAADTGDFQVGIRLAHLLDRPVVAGAQRVEVDGGGDVATMTVGTAEGTEVYEVGLPAVATVMEGGVTPRYPSIKGRMRAKKAPVEVLEPRSEPVGPGRLGLRLPPAPPSEVTVLGEGPGAAPALVEVLRQIGVVS